jgi:hypothetical protein
MMRKSFSVKLGVRPLGRVSPEAVIGYIVHLGFKETERLGDKAAVFQHKSGIELVVPLRINLGDYNSRMADVLDLLSRQQDRSQAAVWADIVAMMAVERLSLSDTGRVMIASLQRQLAEVGDNEDRVRLQAVIDRVAILDQLGIVDDLFS